MKFIIWIKRFFFFSALSAREKIQLHRLVPVVEKVFLEKSGITKIVHGAFCRAKVSDIDNDMVDLEIDIGVCSENPIFKEHILEMFPRVWLCYKTPERICHDLLIKSNYMNI